MNVNKFINHMGAIVKETTEADFAVLITVKDEVTETAVAGFSPEKNTEFLEKFVMALTAIAQTAIIQCKEPDDIIIKGPNGELNVREHIVELEVS